MTKAADIGGFLLFIWVITVRAMVVIKIMGLAAASTTNLRNTIQADTHNVLPDLRGLFLYFNFFIRCIMFLRPVELDLTALGTAVYLYLQCTGKNVGPIAKKRTRLSQLNLFLLDKMQFMTASGTFNLSHC